jgi:outer membrane protein
MYGATSHIALVCVFLLLAPYGSFAADDPPPGATRAATIPGYSQPPGGLLGRIEGPYRPKPVPPPNVSNTSRLDSLIRAGNLYLSLQDAIALVLETNLDIEIQRYGPQVAETNVMMAEAGGFARGVSTSITGGPSSASVSSSGTTPGTNQNAATQASAGTSTAVGSAVLQQSGPSIPSLDPVLTGSATWAHITSPQSSAFTTGTNALISSQNNSGVAIQKSFLTGTIVSLGLTNNNVTNNSIRADFNPATTSALSFSFTQHLLQGFGPGVNSRQIRIAKNNREVSDLTFKLQVETTVAAVMELYWDLVAFNQAVQVARDALAASQRLLDNNKQQVAVGTLAPIEITRAEAEIAGDEQALTVAQMRVLQQETIIKNALSKTGIASPAIASARIIPTDQIRVPDVEAVSPIQDLTSLALSSRPELAQSRIQIQNQLLTLRGSKNALLPTLDAVAGLSNGALAGQPNPLPGQHSNTPFFIGGYGTVLSQLFARNFPNYSAGFNLSIPIRNRSAQAQIINDQLTLRQQQLGLQRLENQVRVDVQNALIGLTQARAQYQAASKAVLLQQQTLDAEQKKLALGASTIYNVILAGRDLTTAQSNLVTAEAAYTRAKVEMDRATGQILYNNNVSLDEAFKGKVSRPPSAIPETPAVPQPQQ